MENPTHYGIWHALFDQTEFSRPLSDLLLDSDLDVDERIPFAEAENELRQLRAQIEGGSLFPSAQAITMPEAINGLGILALGTRRPPTTAEQDAASELRATSPPRVFTRPSMAGVGATMLADGLPVAPAAPKSAAPPTNTTPRSPPTYNHDSNERRESAGHDAFEKGNFAIADEDDIPFDFDSSKPVGPQDQHDAPF